MSRDDLVAAQKMLDRWPELVVRGGGAAAPLTDGESFACADEVADFARKLCASDQITMDSQVITEPTLDLVATLVNEGALAFED